ncbi:hypothetical protein EMEDMD4_1140014 [Sinorhizobium medicae]|uniref:Uncharacterized protein n=1 Tax=Sinorhizobium medicae TaxID=110321 RepID=A0A508WU75_9HYPH|nr:hypothetical protein EMEDMD4_1140014 [Sinorhizobium medicae]
MAARSSLRILLSRGALKAVPVVVWYTGGSGELPVGAVSHCRVAAFGRRQYSASRTIMSDAYLDVTSIIINSILHECDKYLPKFLCFGIGGLSRK